MLVGTARKDGAGSGVVARTPRSGAFRTAVNLLHSAPETELRSPDALPDAAAGTTVERFLAAVRRKQAQAVALEAALLGVACLGAGAAVGGLLARAWPRGARWVLVLGLLAAVGAGRRAGLAALDARGGKSLSHRRDWWRPGSRASRSTCSPRSSFAGRWPTTLRSPPSSRWPTSTRSMHGPRSWTPRPSSTARQSVGPASSPSSPWRRWRWSVASGLTGCEHCSRRSGRPQSSGAPGTREPITSELEVLYQYPAYTGLSPRTVTSTGDLAGPKGTVVQLRTRADRTVTGAHLQLSTGAVVPLRVDHGRDLSGSLVLQATGTYAVVFTGRASREAARGPDIPLTVEADAPPQVSILLPAAGAGGATRSRRCCSTTRPRTTTACQTWRWSGRGPTARRIARSSRTTTAGRAPGSTGGSSRRLKLAAGDRVTYYVEAKDNDAVEGPRRGLSRTRCCASTAPPSTGARRWGAPPSCGTAWWITWPTGWRARTATDESRRTRSGRRSRWTPRGWRSPVTW